MLEGFLKFSLSPSSITPWGWYGEELLWTESFYCEKMLWSLNFLVKIVCKGRIMVDWPAIGRHTGKELPASKGSIFFPGDWFSAKVGRNGSLFIPAVSFIWQFFLWGHTDFLKSGLILSFLKIYISIHFRKVCLDSGLDTLWVNSMRRPIRNRWPMCWNFATISCTGARWGTGPPW